MLALRFLFLGRVDETLKGSVTMRMSFLSEVNEVFIRLHRVLNM